MSQLILPSPLTFEPLFMERMWGGRRLESVFDKRLPPELSIGESWEIVDRPEAQSVVRHGLLRGRTLHQLWAEDRQLVFGEVPDSPNFPLLIKLLDAQDDLSLQVHPPGKVAASLGGEAKTEFWYVAAALPGAKLLVGLRQAATREEFQESLEAGDVAQLVHAIPVKAGDAMFLPAGRLHAVGGGNLLVEIQQNSDTTYRVFDWNRVDDKGRPRTLHVRQALRCIDFNDVQPKLVRPEGEVWARNEFFEVQKWNLQFAREAAPAGQFAIVFCLGGAVRCSGVDLQAGEFCLVPAALEDRQLHPQKDGTTLLRVTVPR